jgi:hypothetical protein
MEGEDLRKSVITIFEFIPLEIIDTILNFSGFKSQWCIMQLSISYEKLIQKFHTRYGYTKLWTKQLSYFLDTHCSCIFCSLYNQISIITLTFNKCNHEKNFVFLKVGVNNANYIDLDYHIQLECNKRNISAVRSDDKCHIIIHKLEEVTNKNYFP